VPALCEIPTLASFSSSARSPQALASSGLRYLIHLSQASGSLAR
jgi:hypothetical protein